MSMRKFNNTYNFSQDDFAILNEMPSVMFFPFSLFCLCFISAQHRPGVLKGHPNTADGH